MRFKTMVLLQNNALSRKWDKLSPIISVVTIAKNHAVGLTYTLESLLSQSFQNWESIIVVGKSIDETLSIAEEFEKRDARIKVVRQLDSGIYEAMNLGIYEVSTESKFINFMNAGDSFYEADTLAKLVKIANTEKASLVIGGYKIKGYSKHYQQKQGVLSDFSFTFSRRTGCHQSMIYSIQAVLDAGAYNTRYRLAADHDLTLKILGQSGARKVEFLVAEMEPGGLSDCSLATLHREKQAIRREYFNKRPWVWLIGYAWQFAALSKISLRSSITGKKHPLG